MFLAIKTRYTHCMFQKKSNTQVLNSLLITQDDKSHYVFIKDFNKLMYSNTKCKDKKRYCMHCLQIFTTE